MITIIAAIDEHNALGYQGHLLYDIPTDKTRFKALTMGHKIVMGHNTYKTIPSLPGREKYVLSRDKTLLLPDATVLHSLQDILTLGQQDNIWIIGGGEVYNLCIPYTQTLYITKIHEYTPQADAFFPQITRQWKAISIKHYPTYDFIIYKKLFV